MIWQNAKISADATHHLLDGEPMYAARFAEVLKFHAPGLAPARTETAAFHIDAVGSPAYPQRYLQAFGFYQGLAAVQASTTWGHITPDGTENFHNTLEWCGNFQEGRCPVRSAGGKYFHIDLECKPLYAERYRYVGDYRDGHAVVQGDDGLHTHVDLAGKLLHGKRFLDLDVFHKRLARARDTAGWHHVREDGTCLYSRRFAVVEPFYNGQARVERFDGGLEVIDHTGDVLVELRPALAI